MTSILSRPERPPLARSATLPSRYYLEPALLEREKERGRGQSEPVTFEALLALARRLEGQSREIVTRRMFTVGIYMRGS